MWRRMMRKVGLNAILLCSPRVRFGGGKQDKILVLS